MLETLNVNEKLQFQPLSEEEKTRRGILGRLFGPCASFTLPTRNGRKYTDELWEKVFDSPIVTELFERGGLAGELDHPADREETCSEKIAIMMPEKPKKDKHGQLVGYFDILDTPCGRIAYALAKYGFKFGISSRGSGDTYTDYDGDEVVDPDTYNLNGFDLVLIPACKTAVLGLTESLKPNTIDVESIKLKKALNEAFTGATEEQRKIMQDTLDNLDIKYSHESDVDTVTANGAVAAEDDGAELLKELQESLRIQHELEETVKSLQEKLSVCYTKEARYSVTLTKTKEQLSEAVSANKKLTEQVETLTATVEERTTSLNEAKQRISSMRESMKSAKTQMSNLTESLAGEKTNARKLSEDIKVLNEKHQKKCKELQSANDKLQESLLEAQKDSKIVRSQANAKITKANELVEKYRGIAKVAIDKYISSQAVRFGISASDIKARLKENYSFNDIDRVCEDLKNYRLTVNSLPFDIQSQRGRKVQMSIKESQEPIKPKADDTHLVDDDVDETLKNFI